MSLNTSRLSIVVGIDGSDAAIRAAEWAVEASADRDLTLRLVHVIEPGSEAIRLETEYGEMVLVIARAAVEAAGRPITVETAIERGDIDTVLARESRNADMICIGSAGTGGIFEIPAGSTSVALAQSAHCSVAFVRAADEATAADTGWSLPPEFRTAHGTVAASLS